MTTRMTHPQHGATYVYGQSEIDRHKGYGWSVEVPASAPPVTPKAWAVAADPDNIPQSFEPVRRKPGPKPKAK